MTIIIIIVIIVIIVITVAIVIIIIMFVIITASVAASRHIFNQDMMQLLMQVSAVCLSMRPMPLQPMAALSADTARTVAKQCFIASNDNDCGGGD